VVLDPLIRALGDKLRSDELTVVVSAQHMELEVTFLLRSSLYMLYGIHNCRICWKKDGPHEPRSIVYQQQEVAPTSCCRWCDGAAEVPVDKLKLLQRVVQSLSKKRSSLVLGHHAGVPQLLDVVDLRHPAHHLLAPELPERLDVVMPKLLVPTPCLIISMSGEAEGPSHVHVKHVKPIAPVVDLGEKATAAVPNLKHASINLDARATLVNLAEADDGVLDGRNVVDSREQLVLVGFTHEHDGLNAIDLHRGLIAELDGALDAADQVGEVPNAPGHVVCGATIEAPVYCATK
jgi:hypothetical protein